MTQRSELTSDGRLAKVERVRPELGPNAERLLLDIASEVAEDGNEDVVGLTDAATLAADLVTLRTVRHLSQTELARRAGIDQGDVSRIERGVTDARVSTFLRLLNALGARLSLEILPYAAERAGYHSRPEPAAAQYSSNKLRSEVATAEFAQLAEATE